MVGVFLLIYLSLSPVVERSTTLALPSLFVIHYAVRRTDRFFTQLKLKRKFEENRERRDEINNKNHPNCQSYRHDRRDYENYINLSDSLCSLNSPFLF